MTLIENLEAMLSRGQDSAMLRFSLGGAYLKDKQSERAVEHLRAAVRQQPDYSAAWKQLGKALADCGNADEAITAYAQGIAVAEGKGDLQAAREMRVFKRRLEKQRDGPFDDE